MIQVDANFFHCNPNYVVWHLETPKNSILCPFSSKFYLLLSRVCIHIHTCSKFGGLFRRYRGEQIVQSQVICFKIENTIKFHFFGTSIWVSPKKSNLRIAHSYQYEHVGKKLKNNNKIPWNYMIKLYELQIFWAMMLENCGQDVDNT